MTVLCSENVMACKICYQNINNLQYPSTCMYA